MPYQLTNLRITAVAAVDDPDNPPAEILLFKRRQDSKEDKTAKPDAEPANKGLKYFQYGKGIMIDLTKLNLTDEQAEAAKEALAETEKQDEEAKAELEKIQQELDELKKAKEADETDVAKRMAELEKRANEDAERVAKMEDEKRTEEAVAIVESWDSIPGATVETYAPIVKAVRASAPGKFDELRKLLDAANAAVKTSVALETVGSDSGTTDVEAQHAAKVEELMKADPTLTRVVARAKAWETPGLQEEYRKQKGAN